MKYGSASSKWISMLGIISLVFTLTIVPSPVIMAQQAAADSQEATKKSANRRPASSALEPDRNRGKGWNGPADVAQGHYKTGVAE